MKITKLLGNEETTPKEKLEAVQTLVNNVRAKYGNTEIEIDAIKVNTVDGYVPLSLLTEAEKVEVATSRIKNAIATATVATENAQGSRFDRVFESMIAIDPIMCNLDQVSDSEY